MDILKPDLMWIEGRCYRVPSIKTCGSLRSAVESKETFNGDELDAGLCETEEICDDFEIDRTENGRYRTAFHVPHLYYSYIIGAKGATKRRLEDETRTQIRIPKQGQSGDVVIMGLDERGVAAARRRINLILLSFRQKQQFTHFLSVPMNGNQIKKHFLEFKEEVCELCKNHRIDASIFQSPEKLHLTLGTMVLADNEERNQVAKMLTDFKETVIQPMLHHQALRLRMVGVEYMNDDPSEVDVLYGKVLLADGSGLDLLQNLVDSLVDFCARKGVMKKQYEHVKLHVTLMNTLFRGNKGEDSEIERPDQMKRVRETFDASTILKTFENYDFGEQIVDAIHLSQRYTTAADGYYQMSTNISFT